MLRQPNIRQAFTDSIPRNPKGYRYLHTRDFVCKLQKKGYRAERYQMFFNPYQMISRTIKVIEKQPLSMQQMPLSGTG